MMVTQHYECLIPQNFTLKMTKLVNFMLCAFNAIKIGKNRIDINLQSKYVLYFTERNALFFGQHNVLIYHVLISEISIYSSCSVYCQYSMFCTSDT